MVRPLFPSLFRVLALAILAIAGCGSPGAPAPPSLNLPAPIEGLTASRKEGSVQLSWTMPTRTTDHIPLKHPVSGEICRKVEDNPCAVIAKLTFPPGKPASYTDVLPPELTSGPLRLLTYEVVLRNRAEKTAGPSGPVYSVAGAGPPAIVGLTAEIRRNGVLLTWHPSTGPEGDGAQVNRRVEFLIQRKLETGSASINTSSTSANSGAPEPTIQNLAVRTADGDDPGRAFDASALLNREYLYTVQRVDTVSLGGRSIQLQGQSSSTGPISTRDVFPPAVPRDLTAVADDVSGAIDLSWTPDTESDLAGYILYRRDLATNLPPERISDSPLPTPNFRDAHTMRGHTYAYSVAAIDQSGNPSVRSPEVVEKLETNN